MTRYLLVAVGLGAMFTLGLLMGASSRFAGFGAKEKPVGLWQNLYMALGPIPYVPLCFGGTVLSFGIIPQKVLDSGIPIDRWILLVSCVDTAAAGLGVFVALKLSSRQKAKRNRKN